MKKIIAVVLALLTALSLIVTLASCGFGAEDGTNVNTETVSENKKPSLSDIISSVLDEKYVYEALLENYVKLPDYDSYEVNLELDEVQATIDNYLMNNAFEYVVARGDDIYVDINVYAADIYATDDGEVKSFKGKKIEALSKSNLLVENIGSSSLPYKIEVDIINSSLSINDIIMRKYSYEDLENYCSSEYEGKSFYFEIKIMDKITKVGDVLEVSYKGYKIDADGNILKDENGNNVAFSEGCGKFFPGTNLTIEDFESNLIGRTLGEEFSLYATFPDDWHDEELSGQTVLFYATVESIYEAPIYNDDFVKTYFPEYSTTQELEESLKKERIIDSMLDFFDKEIDILKYPKAEYNAIKSEIEAGAADFKEFYGYTFDEYIKQTYNMTRDEYIKSQMKTEMMYYAIAASEGIKPALEMITNEKAELIAHYKEIYTTEQGFGEAEALEKAKEYVAGLSETYIYENVLYDLVKDFLYDNAEVKIIEKTYVSITETIANN